ncbi:hypothetical protein D349_00461 [Enterococcus faecalis UP2S-6]|nr:hypothetical protein D349_00461 [Enterococcus faecalis UP2S-6]
MKPKIIPHFIYMSILLIFFPKMTFSFEKITQKLDTTQFFYF